MCDVMPTIAEDNISQRSSQFSGEDANFEQLMVSMLDERDKLMDSLREAQERLNESELRLNETEKERDSLQRQINANLPQVCASAYQLINRIRTCNGVEGWVGAGLFDSSISALLNVALVDHNQIVRHDTIQQNLFRVG